MNTTPYIQAISTMDISLLASLLDENELYMECTKKVFLKKMETLFETFKEAGDTYLINGNGRCNTTSCHNSGCIGSVFIGNISKNYINFTFEEDETKANSLQECYFFETEKPIFGLKQKLSLHIYESDEVGYEAEPEYLEQNKIAENALKELTERENKNLSHHDYLGWVNKHKAFKDQMNMLNLYIDIDDALNKFENLFTYFLNLISIYDTQINLENEISEVQKIQAEDWTELGEWLRQQRFYKYSIIQTNLEKNKIEDFDLYYKLDDFDIYFIYKSVYAEYNEKYDNQFDKYNIGNFLD